MTQIKYHQIPALIQSKNLPEAFFVFLLYGDSYLKRKSAQTIIEFIQTVNQHQISTEVFQGDEINVSTIIESLTTFSFLFPKKLIVIKDLPLSESGKKNNLLSKDAIASLAQCIKAGFPDNHFLVITTDTVDKRKAFYKTVESVGTIVDCSIPEGSRYADIQEKTGIFKSIVQQKLSAAHKTIKEDAFVLMIDQIGFELDSVLDSIEKLISFSGDAGAIDIRHVRSVVTRIKKDPIFDFTNAMMDRKPADSLMLCESLIQNGFHPLQILAALSSQFRKILFVKCFIEGRKQKGIWHKTMTFNTFKQTTLPIIISFDSANKESAEKQEAVLKNTNDENKKWSSDLVLASQPKNAYPVFHTFLKSENFSMIELVHVFTQINHLDFRLKSESIDPGEALKHFIIQTCTKEH